MRGGEGTTVYISYRHKNHGYIAFRLSINQGWCQGRLERGGGNFLGNRTAVPEIYTLPDITDIHNRQRVETIIVQKRLFAGRPVSYIMAKAVRYEVRCTICHEVFQNDCVGKHTKSEPKDLHASGRQALTTFCSTPANGHKNHVPQLFVP